MEIKPLSRHLLPVGPLLLVVLVSACGPGRFPGPTVTPPPTITLTPSLTPTRTEIPTSTDTPIPPTASATPTRIPQTILLRRKCGRDHTVRANQPLKLLYGGWGVFGKELADQWMTALEVDLTIDGEVISGELQPPVLSLPYNCTADPADLYWLYYTATIPELSPGEHFVRVVISARRRLPDGSGPLLGPGPLLEQTFFITARE